MTAIQNYSYDTATETAPKEYLFKVLVIGEFGVGRSIYIGYSVVFVDYFFPNLSVKVTYFTQKPSFVNLYWNCFVFASNAKTDTIKIDSSLPRRMKSGQLPFYDCNIMTCCISLTGKTSIIRRYTEGRMRFLSHSVLRKIYKCSL